MFINWSHRMLPHMMAYILAMPMANCSRLASEACMKLFLPHTQFTHKNSMNSTKGESKQQTSNKSQLTLFPLHSPPS